MNSKEASAVGAALTNATQRVNGFSLTLLRIKPFAVHIALRISILMLICAMRYLDAMIVFRERLLSREWFR